MRMRECLLVRFPVLPGIIQASRFPVLLLLVKVSVNQCPGIMYSRKEKQSKCIKRLVVLLSPLRKRGIVKHRRERRARERENNSESFIHDARWANQRSLVPGSSSVPVRVIQPTPQAVDPISSMRKAVYSPLESVGNPTANENSPFQIGLESRRNLGLYKPTAPDPNQDTWAYNFAANSSEVGPLSPTRTFASEQLGLRKQDRDYIPPSATWKTSWCLYRGGSLPTRASSPSTPWPTSTWESYAAAGSSCKPPMNLQAT